jgi:hypothetical protein
MLFRNLTTSLGETGCEGGQGSPRAVAPSEEEEEEEYQSEGGGRGLVKQVAGVG